MTETRLANNYKTKVGPICDLPPAGPSASHSYTLLNRHGPAHLQVKLSLVRAALLDDVAGKVYQVLGEQVKDIADAWRAHGEEWNGNVRLSI